MSFNEYFSSASFKIQGSVRKVGLLVNSVQFLFEIRCLVPGFAENPPNSPMKSKKTPNAVIIPG